MLDYELLGMNVKKRRMQKNLTQRALAEIVGCEPSHISNIENSYTKVSLDLLLSIANVLETSIDYLLAEQYNDTSMALDNAIKTALRNCDDEKKEKLLKIIDIL